MLKFKHIVFYSFCFIILSSYLLFSNEYLQYFNIPQEVEDFLSVHFYNDNIVNYMVFNDSYQMVLESGLNVGVLRNGQLSYVDGNFKPIPTKDFIPYKVLKTVERLYPNANIYRVEKDWNIYEINLDNSLILVIDAKGILYNRKYISRQ